MSKQQLICTEHHSSLVPTDFILLYKKDNERIAWQQSAHLSWSAVVHKLFSSFWWAVRCEQLRRAVSWVQWSGCIHRRNMKSVHIIGCSVSTPRKMCSEPRTSSASRKSACKRSSSTRGLLSTYLFQLDMKIVRGLLLLRSIFIQIMVLLISCWCSDVLTVGPVSSIFPWLNTDNNHCDNVLVKFTRILRLGGN